MTTLDLTLKDIRSPKKLDIKGVPTHILDENGKEVDLTKLSLKSLAVLQVRLLKKLSFSYALDGVKNNGYKQSGEELKNITPLIMILSHNAMEAGLSEDAYGDLMMEALKEQQYTVTDEINVILMVKMVELAIGKSIVNMLKAPKPEQEPKGT